MADLDEIVGESPAIESVRNDLRRLLALTRERRRLPAILIQGETGTGKGLVAKLLHRHGPRARGPFVDLNCAAIPETMLEGELFGYEQGAFTDARRAKPGLLQTSSGGVLFLDEIGLLSPSLQAKLLTALEERTVRRIGSTTKETFDSWIISATNADLERGVRERRFREDLYHRLAVLTVQLPPLRERGYDAALLAQRFLERACGEYGLPVKSLGPDALALVARDPWPGNVRELANVMERLALLVDGRDVVGADVAVVRGGDRSVIAPAPAPAARGEREQLLAALETTGWNITRTAAVLGITRNTVRARMDRLGLRARKEPEASQIAAVRDPAPEPTPAAPEPAVSALAAAQWERKHVTLLRVGLAASQERSRDAALLLSLAADKILGFGGRVESLGQETVDGSFGAVPVDNAARRAVSAALAIHSAVAQAGPPGLAATTVVHTEPATIGQVGDHVLIDEAERPTLGHLLARLLAGAEPSRVRVSAQTAAFVERHFELVGDHGPDPALAATFTIVRRDPTGLGAWRRLTRFVGRETEMNLLVSRWELARQGRGQVVALGGEPGSGKSRLLMEFIKARDPLEALVLHAAMSATEDSSRARPAASLLRGLLAIGPDDSADEILDRIAARLRTLKLGAAWRIPLAGLLDVQVDDPAWTRLEPQLRARRMLDALRHLVVHESQVRPLIVVLEDLHWIDADTQVALDQLVDVVPTAHILVVAAYRPEYRHGWANKTFYTQLRVDPLPASPAQELLEDLLGGEPDSGLLRQRILEWTEGNPFFIEEGVRTLAETGALAGTAGSYRVVREVAEHALPATVEDTLAARIHRLPAITRHVLQCSAVLGVEFRRAVLGALAGLPEDRLGEGIRALEEAEFVYPTAGGHEPAYTFKHALTHLVAYRSVPPERQQALHAQAQRALEVLYAGQVEAHVEALAEHAFRGEVWERAATYLRSAGAKALARSANRAAAEYLERAIVACDRAGDQGDHAGLAIDLRLDLRHALTPLGDADRILERLREAEAIATRIADARRLGMIVSFETNALFSLGDHDAAVERGHRALAIARDLDDVPMAIAAEQFVGRALHAQGRYRAAADIFRRLADALAGDVTPRNLGLPVPPAVFARTHLALCLIEMGEFEEAARAGDEALRAAETASQAEAVQWACYALGLLALERGEHEAAVSLLERVRAICRDAELPVYLPRTEAALGHARVLLGQADGLAQLERAVARADQHRQVNVYASAMARLADAYLHLGRIDDAARTAEQATTVARARGLHGTEARVLTLLGLAYQHAEPPRFEEAEALYRTALAITEELEMQPQAALCRLRLGTLLRAAGRPAEAVETLRAAETAAGRLGLATAAAEAAQQLAGVAGSGVAETMET